MNDLGWINATWSDHAQSQLGTKKYSPPRVFHKFENLTQDVGRLIALRVHLQHRLSRCFLIRIVVPNRFLCRYRQKIITVIDPTVAVRIQIGD